MVLHKTAARGVHKLLQWNLDITKNQGMDNILFAIPRSRYIEVLFHIFNYRPVQHSCKQMHQLEAEVDKIQWFVGNRPTEPRPHFFLFAHWSVMRERSIPGVKQKKKRRRRRRRNVCYSEDIQNLPFFRLKSTWIFLEFLWIVGSGAADQN